MTKYINLIKLRTNTLLNIHYWMKSHKRLRWKKIRWRFEYKWWISDKL